MSKKDKPFQALGINALFGEPLEIETDKTTLPLVQIHLPDSQPRHYFAPEKMAQLVASIRVHGIIQPLLVRPLDNYYELVAGERRYRAAIEVGLSEVPVVIKDLTDETARQLALIENLHREDLNPVEEVEGILQLLTLTLKLPLNEVTSALHSLKNKKEGKIRDNVIRNEREQSIQEVFDKLGQNWYSFVCNRLPLLNWPDDLLFALAEGKIAYTKAKVIAKVKDEEPRQALLAEAIAAELSLSQIKQRIKELTAPTIPEVTLEQKIKDSFNRFAKSRLWEDPKKKQKFERLLAQMEALLEDESV